MKIIKLYSKTLKRREKRDSLKGVVVGYSNKTPTDTYMKNSQSKPKKSSFHENMGVLASYARRLTRKTEVI